MADRKRLPAKTRLTRRADAWRRALRRRDRRAQSPVVLRERRTNEDGPRIPGWATVPPPRNREGGFANGEILGPGKLLIPVRFRSDVKLDPNRVGDSRGQANASTVGPLDKPLTVLRKLLGDTLHTRDKRTGKLTTLADISKSSPARSASSVAAGKVASLVRRPRVRAGLGWGNGAVTNNVTVNPGYADEANQPGMPGQPVRLAPKRRTRARSGGGARAM